eukprot:Plantae.Rhodophyta-Purpureofilum_apyrenoidigerum.ctg9148.p1 GENE.Plantae.Rhodophyta-Purpureofilum_apyrenoidigerum.ctg9148~~Plantae.Rhodophyta-Purpureofilum_apyrenoidigerum.ctg9148.p1  ORF type:complete len:739 (-),score=149.09 Plantae.Rhodophyta-Purpureofilum_apyrenoidigerum.ctg9148:110-2326(-)
MTTGFVSTIGKGLGTDTRSRQVGTQPRRRRTVPIASSKGTQFGAYSGVAEAGLVPTETFDGARQNRNVFEIEVQLPLGLVLAELAGGVYVAAVKPGGNVDRAGTKVRVGDRILGTSSTFGQNTWPALSLERVLSALKTRYRGEVTLILERSGLSEDVYESDEEENKSIQNSTGSEGVKLSTDDREAEHQVRNALKSFVELRKAGLPAIQTLTTLVVRSGSLLKRYSSAGGHFASIESLYKKLQRAQVPIDSKLYNLFMNAYVVSGHPDRAVEIFKEISTPNTECCTTVIKAYSKMNDFENMEKTKLYMESTGVLPSERTYNTLISAYASKSKLEKVEALFKEMIDRHLKPNVVTWNIRMNAHAKAKSGGNRMAKVIQLFQEMKRQKIEPNKITYTTLLGTCVSCGDLLKAEVILSEMCNRGIKPDTYTYNKLIEGYGDRLRSESAVQLLTKLEEDEDLKPDAYSYGLTIRACCAVGQVETATSIMKRMKDRGFKPEAQVYIIMLRAYAKAGDTVNSFRILKEMQDSNMTPDYRAMTTLMHACVEAGDGNLALSVYSKMVQLRMEPDVVTYTTLIRAYAKKKDVTMAVRAFNNMTKKGLKPNSTTYNAVLEAAMNGRSPSFALQLFKDMITKDKTFLNKRTYQILLNSEIFDNSPNKYLEFLLSLYKAIREADMYGNGKFYCEILRTCAKAADWTRASDLVQDRKTGEFRVSGKDMEIALDVEKKVAVMNNRLTNLHVR